MKQSFAVKKKAGAAAGAADAPEAVPAPEPTKVPDKTVATRPDATVAEPIPPSADMSGDFNVDDIRWPRVNLIHKTSKEALIETFGIGSFALNQEVKMSNGKTPIEVTVLRFQKDYVQKLPFGDVEKPKSFKTEDEVRESGGSLNYADVDSGNYFMPRGHMQLLISQPEDQPDDLFPHAFDGKNYGLALLTVSSSAYTSAGKEIATLRANNKVMRKGLRFGKLLLTSDGRKSAKFSWVVPVLKFNGENTPEFVTFAESLLSH